MTDKEQLNLYLNDETQIPTQEWVAEMRGKYPYFILPALLRMQRARRTMQKSEHDALMAYLAFNCANRRALSISLSENLERFVAFYPLPKAQQQPTTDSTIDNFLNQFGSNNPRENAALENLIFNPTPEYALDDVGTTSTAPTDEQDDKIASFLNAHPVTQNAPTPKPEPDETAVSPTLLEPIEEEQDENINPTATTGNESFSEGLAFVYIRQGKYHKAYEMLKSLSESAGRTNPNIEDQLRFLSKLIHLTVKK